MLHLTTQKSGRGFSLIELLIVVAVIMILAAISVPRLLNTISDINLRYAATNISGLLQSARSEKIPFTWSSRPRCPPAALDTMLIFRAGRTPSVIHSYPSAAR